MLFFVYILTFFSVLSSIQTCLCNSHQAELHCLTQAPCFQDNQVGVTCDVWKQFLCDCVMHRQLSSVDPPLRYPSGKNILLFKAFPIEQISKFATEQQQIQINCHIDKNCQEWVLLYKASQCQVWSHWLKRPHLATGSKKTLFKKKHPRGMRDNDPPHRALERLGISRPAISQCQNKPWRNALQGFSRESIIQQQY